jgi:AcrR family transcriptional regulator
MTGQERREQLLDVGRSLFADKGFEAVSVEEIAAKAGVSKPVVYEHFGGKEGLYAVLVDREMNDLLHSISDALTAGTREGAARTSRHGAVRLHRHESRRLSHPGARFACLAIQRILRQFDRRHRRAGGTPARPGIRQPRHQHQVRRGLLPGAGGHGGAHRSVVARCAQAWKRRRGLPPGEPRVERPGAPGTEAAVANGGESGQEAASQDS